VNSYEAIVAKLEADWPKWQIWFVPRAVGRPAATWHARRWDGNGPVINEASAVDLAEAIGQAEKEQS
jgi:hypothetical protein